VKYDIEIDYQYTLSQIMKLLALFGQDENLAENVTLGQLDDWCIINYFPITPNIKPNEALLSSDKILVRKYQRTRITIRRFVYWRDLLKARIAENG
jgi:hypothetical protein